MIYAGASAEESMDAVYRYELRRTFLSGTRKILWIMLNPSTVNASEDDPTIRKCVGFSRKGRFKEMIVCNLFAYRATHPKDLRKLTYVEAVGPRNLDTLQWAINIADVCVCAWGGMDIRLIRLAEASVITMIQEKGIQPMCLGTTKSGAPRHPLFVPYRTTMVPFELAI